MFQFKYYLGVDMSKLTFDYCLLADTGEIIKTGKIDNDTASIATWIEEIEEQFTDLTIWSSILVCMEHSGYYASPLLKTIHAQTPAKIWLESALQIKRSMGMQRGKNDRIDAQRIACYAYDFQRKARFWQPSSKSIERLGLLLSHRDRLVRNWLSLSNSLKEEIGYVEEALHEEMECINRPAIEAVEQAIEQCNQKITSLLEQDSQLARKTEIVQSIPGFGTVISAKIIEVTRGFTRLTNPRALACFAGVAPFEYSSGTSLKGKTRISHLANKDLKKMLHLAALVTIRKGNIMHDYFQRKVAEGKNKMAVINAVRNKLIHILLACIKNDTTYDKNYSHKLA